MEANSTDDKLRSAAFELWQELTGATSGSDRASSVTYPWYDSTWLSRYVRARDHLAANDPDQSARFVEAMCRFRLTDRSFSPVVVDDIIDDDTLDRIRSEVAARQNGPVERHEVETFGRDVIHDNPFFLQLQAEVRERVEGIVGHELELSYNFLSLYGSDGRCAVHMDAPEAMWTLDICVDQSRRWPIHISNVVEWPEDWVADPSRHWEQQIRTANRFQSYEMEPGQALIFCGANQWHYRDAMVDATPDDFCTLLFFHFVPKDSGELVDYRQWSRLFGVPKVLLGKSALG